MKRGDGDFLIAKILGGHDSTEALAYELLKAIFSGYPVERLRLLLHAERLAAVEEGAWVLVELGRRGRLLIDEIPGLLHHSSPHVRNSALNSVMAIASSGDERLLAEGIGLVHDEDYRVRKTAIRLLAVKDAATLDAAAVYLPEADRDQVRWMLTQAVGPGGASEIVANLSRADLHARRFAAAAALRLATANDEPLRVAARSDDRDVKEFAELELRVAAARQAVRDKFQ